MRLLLSAGFLLLCCSCYEPQRECINFQQGTFTFEALVGTELETTTFVRNDSIEIDYFRGKADTSSIRWINDCEYILKKLHPKNRAEEKAVHIKILTTEESSYRFEYKIVGETKKQQGVAYKKIANTKS